ncbi:MAG TPA: type IV pilus twitching motility protein PilT [Bdellovibrionota bacterium]|nr:type IV pilus twitching motility protein PilT [Bdellovibrionota bacterium]
MSVTITQLLQYLVQHKGSDLHVAAGSVPMVRIRGDLMKVGGAPALSVQDIEAMAAQITTNPQKAELQKDKSIDFAFKASGIGIFRVNLFYQRNGLAIVMRILTEKPPTLEDLKLPEACKVATSLPNGLVLVTGPTGSGKSTTLAAMLNHINMNVNGHILTLEDPIEFQHESKLCMVNQRSLGSHFTTFASAMRAALREDPDIILVGEMRDPETIALAIKAAETGHLVFSTLHTNSAAKTIDRMINVFPADEQPQIRTVLSETLRMVIAQKLVPSADKSRRYCIHDILVNNNAVANLVREGKTFQIPSIMQTGRKEGMQLADKVMLEQVEKGEIDGSVAYEYAAEKSMFAKWAPKNPFGFVEKPEPGAPGTPAAPAAPGMPPGVKKAA